MKLYFLITTFLAFTSLSAYAGTEFQVRGDAMVPVASCTTENIDNNLVAAIEAATAVAQVKAYEECGEQNAVFIKQNYIGTSCLPIMDSRSAVSANVVPHFQCISE